MLHHRIGLPLLEAEPHALMRVVLIVSLVFMVFHLDEVAVDGVWGEGEGDERVDGGRFGEELECPALPVVSISVTYTSSPYNPKPPESRLYGKGRKEGKMDTPAHSEIESTPSH